MLNPRVVFCLLFFQTCSDKPTHMDPKWQGRFPNVHRLRMIEIRCDMLLSLWQVWLCGVPNCNNFGEEEPRSSSKGAAKSSTSSRGLVTSSSNQTEQRKTNKSWKTHLHTKKNVYISLRNYHCHLSFEVLTKRQPFLPAPHRMHLILRMTSGLP